MESLSAFTHRRLNELDIRPRKGLGQNFLIDQGIIDKIVAASNIAPTDNIVEVGPGIGALTRSLVQTQACINAFEIDGILADSLKVALDNPENLTVVKSDILKCQMSDYFDNKPYKVVANLPYYITSPIIRHFLENDPAPESLTIMVQYEVAKTIMAKPGEMNLLALGVQMYGNVSLVTKVSKGCFYPAPKVDSAVIKVVPYDKALISRAEQEDFFTLARAGFAQVRKQIQNPLSHVLGLSKETVYEILNNSQIDPTRRAETLSIDEWLKLFEYYQKVK